MFKRIKNFLGIILAGEENLLDNHFDFYQLYFYAPANKGISSKRQKSVWYSNPEPFRKRGIPIVRTKVRLDRRMYDADKVHPIFGYEITLIGKAHKHFCRTAKAV